MRITFSKLLNVNIVGRFYSTTQPNRVPIKSRKTTVDRKDVEHHASFSDIWWDEKGKLEGLHTYNRLRLPFVQDRLANTDLTRERSSFECDKIKILDVGCGGGILTEALARIYGDVTGIDASKTLIETASKHAGLDPKLSESLHYFHTTIEEHSETHANKYDAIIASEVIEHVADPALFVESCAAIIKPGGMLLLTTMSRTMRSWLNNIIAHEYIFRTIPRGTHQWKKFISPNETKKLLELNGFEIKLVRGIFYNPIDVHWYWTSTTAYGYGLHAIKK